jgi:hypothetical protein
MAHQSAAVVETIVRTAGRRFSGEVSAAQDIGSDVVLDRTFPRITGSSPTAFRRRHEQQYECRRAGWMKRSMP